MTLPLPRKALDQNVIVLGKTRSGKSSALRKMAEIILAEGERFCLIDPKGDWWGLKLGANGKSAGFPVVIFGGKHADIPINQHSGAHIAELIASGNRPCIIDLSEFSLEQRAVFFAQFAAALFKALEGSLYLFIDECHNFTPKGRVFDVEQGKMLHWANRLASEGLGKGLMLFSASQRPQKVHNDFLTSHETLIAKRVTTKWDRDAISDWMKGCADPVIGKEVLDTLAEMTRSEAWAWSPEIKFGPKRITFPFFSTYDSFKPQSQGTVKRLKGWASVNLDDIKAKLSAVVEEVKANDPAALKVEIARLKKELAAKPVPVAAPKVDLRERDRAVAAKATANAYRDATAKIYPRAFLDGWNACTEDIWDRVCKLSNRVSDEYRAQRFTPPKKIAIPDDLPKGPAVEVIEQDPKAARAQMARAIDTALTQHIEAPARANPSPGNSALRKAHRAILGALAQFPGGAAKTKVALVCGYASTGGGFNNALIDLRRDGLVEGYEELKITPAGKDAAGDMWKPLPTGPELLNHWLHHKTFKKAHRAILTALVGALPASMTKQELALATDYEPGGGGFNNALSQLRTLELISGFESIKASEEFQ